MSDLISRQAAIKIANEECFELKGLFGRIKDGLNALPPAQPENQVHLCDSCRHVYPECPSGKDDVIFGNGKGNDNICACNKYEPSAQPEQRWILCSERLPEKKDDYLCSYRGCTLVDICEYDPDRNEWGFYYDYGWKVVSIVIAWMPLPEPYKAERREDED